MSKRVRKKIIRRAIDKHNMRVGLTKLEQREWDIFQIKCLRIYNQCVIEEGWV